MDTTTQFKWIPQRSVGSTEVGTSRSNVEEAGAKLERLKRRLEALKEREAVDGTEQNQRKIPRVRLKDVNVPILKTTDTTSMDGQI